MQSSKSLVVVLACAVFGGWGGAFAEGLPDGWASADIGAPGQAGSAAYNAETRVWTVRGGGSDVWDQADHFQFAYQTRGQNFDARARVSSLQNTNGWAKAGLMVRATTDAGSIHAMLVGTPQDGLAFQWRSNTNDYMSHSGVGAADFPNVWVRLTRNGNTVTAYKATDAAGENWQEVATLNLALPDAVLVGLLVTAHDDAQLCTATFDGVQVYDVPQGSGDGLKGYYHADQGLARNPVLTRVDSTVNFDWAQGAADPALPADHFSVRWLGQVEPQFSETYTFYARADDGVRLWVNGQLLVDAWRDQGASEYSGSIALQAGQKYDLRMEYYENGGDASAQLRWSSPFTPKQIVPQTQLYSTGGGMVFGTGTGLAGTYSNDITFSDPVLARVDPVVDLNWGGGAPDSTVNADFFTVRWQGQVEAQFSETYTFTTRTDDGVRLWVDGQLLVDKWVGQGATEWSGSVALVAGQKYDLKMEYVEFWGDAVAQLSWSSPSTPKQIVPQSQLYPDPDILVAPTVVSTAPADGGQLDQLAAAISVSFSRPMNHAATESAFSTSPASSGTFSWDGNTMTFVPTDLLAADTLYTATVSTGARDIAGNALAADYSFTFTTGRAPGTGDGLAGYYSNGRDLTQIVLRRVDPTVNFNWGQGSPDAAVNSDNFTVRWLGQVEARWDGEYTFYIRSDDGARLWVNGQLLVDKWQDQSATEWSGAISLQGGAKYDLKLEYYENGGDASCLLSWSCPLTPKQVIPQSQLYSTGGAMFIGSGDGLRGQYFQNPDLLGIPASTRVDPVVAFDWGQGAPDEGFAADNFSIRWTGEVQACYTGPTTFYVRADDGVMLWVNNQLLLNEWKPQSATEYAATIVLVAGEKVPIRIEYFERTGDATMRLSWSGAMQPKTVIPQSQFYSTGAGMTAKIPATSAVSPVCIEGVFWPPEEGILTNITVSGPAGSADVKALGEDGFYANVALAANAASTITVTQGSTGTVVSGEVAWTSTDLAGKSDSQDSLTIRRGDSLLLTATGTGSALRIIATGANDSIYDGLPGDVMVAQYDSPGILVAEAWIDDVEVGSLTVNVVDVDLSKPIACEVNYQREKEVLISPACLASSVLFAPGDSSVLDVSVKGPLSGEDGEGTTIYLMPLRRGSPVVIARLGNGDGPIIAAKEIDEFTVDMPAVVGTLINDGTSIGQTRVTLRPYIPFLRFQFDMFASTSTFEGGVTQVSVDTSDYDQETGRPRFEKVFDEATGEDVGKYLLKIETPPGETMYCFSCSAFQASSREKEIKSKKNANGKVCRARVDDLVLAVGETNNLNLTVTQAKDTPETHDIKIAPSQGAAAANKPPVFADPGKSELPGGLDCQAAKVGVLQPKSVKATNADVGWYDVVIDNTPFEKAISVISGYGCTIIPATMTVSVKGKGAYSFYRVEQGADGGEAAKGCDGFWSGGSSDKFLYVPPASKADGTVVPVNETGDASVSGAQSVTARGEKAGKWTVDAQDDQVGYATAELVVADVKVSSVTGRAELWWFDRVDSIYPDYPTEIMLEAKTSEGQPYGGVVTFVVTQGQKRAVFKKSNKPIGHSVTVAAGERALLASLAESKDPDDVVVSAFVDGFGVASLALTVFRPTSLAFLRNDDTVGPPAGQGNGFGTYIRYRILEQFGQPISHGRKDTRIGINEKFTNFPGTLPKVAWPDIKPQGGTRDPDDWPDYVWVAGNLNPQPTPLQTPPSATLVREWNGEWRVGSTGVGLGAKVGDCTWRQYLDRGRHKGHEE